MANEQKPTAYVVLSRIDSPDQVVDPSWAEHARVDARSGEQAIKEGTKQQGGGHRAGTYKAISARAWDSDANNLVVKSETRPVSLFERPGQATPSDSDPEGDRADPAAEAGR